MAEQVNGAARFFATDHLGSVREVTDATGTLLARYAFDPWGRRTVTAGTDVTTVGFTGHRTHTGSGLALALYRGYDAGLAKWTSEDPIRLRGGTNLYGYVLGNPLRYIDKRGLAAMGIGLGVGGSLIPLPGKPGAIGDASCISVVDTKGNIGLLCCKGVGGGVGESIGVEGQLTGLVCPTCESICDLP